MKRLIALILSIFLIGLTQNLKADYPVVSHRYLADPASLVYNGRVYLFCSNDNDNSATGNGDYRMSSIVCVSSSDLKNWTDHGEVFRVPRDASWANLSWAPSAVERDGKFYLYFPNGASNIGVAVSDRPTGPYQDPIGKPLIDADTPGVQPADNIWIFDPMTFVDDDGRAYLYFGGNGENNMRIIELNEDLISTKGEATTFFVPKFFEAAWMHKRNGIYYFSYSTLPETGLRIDYMTSDNPTTGFTYQGVMSGQPPENNNNNHHAVFEFQGKWYQAYHNRIVAREAGISPNYRRNICLDEILYNTDGTIQQMVNTEDGVSQVGYLNPYTKVEAETMNDQSGIETAYFNDIGMAVTNGGDGDWIKVRGLDFDGEITSSFTGYFAGLNEGSSLELRLDTETGPLIGTVEVEATGSAQTWQEQTIEISQNVEGVHDLYFIFRGGDAETLFTIDYWYFNTKPTVLSASLKQGVSVYPNPARDHVNLIFGDDARPVEWIIRDLSGKVLLRGVKAGEESINVSSLQHGIYMLSVRQDGLWNTERLRIE
ncbi:family 43 glycosylhydrolase [Marinoscillum pacificum]|uniref:family 43 glycosylhydrolase n=1 Tax=Marinoscillum pacificum TaxID=392723 RepID=UPI00215727EA|nr:family 43 glycosylhydrolase [Marinoscillum pacificum]